MFYNKHVHRYSEPFILSKLTGTSALFEATKSRLHFLCDRMISVRQDLLRNTPRQNTEKLNVILDDDSEDFLQALLLADLPAEQIRETLIMLIFAGNDNNVNALGWSLDLLKKDEHRNERANDSHTLSWIQRMREEAKEMTSSGEIIKFSEINVCSTYPSYFIHPIPSLRIFLLFIIHYVHF